MEKYDTVEDILAVFYNLRLKYYGKRKDHMVGKMQEDYERLENKVWHDWLAGGGLNGLALGG